MIDLIELQSGRPWAIERAARTPEALAMTWPGGSIDFGELARRSGALAQSLAGYGLGPGNVVAALLENGLRPALLLHAAQQCGVTLLPLNARLAIPEMSAQLADARARLLIHDGREPGDRAQAAAGDVPTAHLDAFGTLALEPAPRSEAGEVAYDPDRPLVLLYTSGTTGRPKGALLSSRCFHASARASAALLGARADDDWLAVLPLFHVGGLSILTRSLLMGTRVTVHDHFDARAVDQAIDAGATMVSLVATMLQRLLDVRGERRAPPTLRVVLLGGGPVPLALLERACRLGFPVAPTYGLTEATSQVATRPPDEAGQPLDAGLHPLPGVAVRIEDPSGAELAPGDVGEICVRGETVMQGYFGQPEASARTLRGGWLHTGDLGAIDVQGRLRVFDRRGDLIISGGENVYPAQVEAILQAHPAIAEAGVVARSDAEYGQRPAAWLVAVDRERPTAEELRIWCRHRMAAYAVPIEFSWLEALPRNASGKLLRRALRDGPSEQG